MALIAVALLALSACGGDDNGGDGGGGEAAAGECGGSGGTTLSISADNTEFDTDELTAPAGEQVTVEFENKDSVAHTFTVGDLDCDTGNVDGGSTAELSFTMPDAETEFVCTIHSNMTGTLVPE
jgi:cytochrome c oxidase subunit II